MPDLSRKNSPQVVACLTAFQDSKTLLLKCNPSVQYAVARHADELYGSERSPTLSVVNAAYEGGVAETWLSIQLNDLANYAGAKEKLTEKQCENTAAVIASQFFYLTLAELMIFFVNFKAGKYGRFYGAIDPLVITEALQVFVKERNAKIDKIERERLKLEREKPAPDNAVTREQYLAIKKLADSGDPIAINKLKQH